jgi:predicted alpha/beta-hydrolase family hydrolase
MRLPPAQEILVDLNWETVAHSAICQKQDESKLAKQGKSFGGDKFLLNRFYLVNGVVV